MLRRAPARRHASRRAERAGATHAYVITTISGYRELRPRALGYFVGAGCRARVTPRTSVAPPSRCVDRAATRMFSLAVNEISTPALDLPMVLSGFGTLN